MEAFNDYTERFLASIEAMGLKDSDVVNALDDLSKGTMSKIRNSRCGVSMNTLQAFCVAYPTINPDYILTGRGDMFKDEESVLEEIRKKHPNVGRLYMMSAKGFAKIKEEKAKASVSSEPSKDSIPYYKELPVSAGKQDIIRQYIEKEESQGWIRLPNVSAMAALPVVGCSMEPYIKAGDFIAIAPVDRWDRIDPDKIYMIITNDERMIKHLMVDDEDDSILWAVSPNYPKFKIYKDEVIEIYKVVFCGRVL